MFFTENNVSEMKKRGTGGNIMCSPPPQKNNEAIGMKISSGIEDYEKISSDEDDKGMCFVIKLSSC